MCQLSRRTVELPAEAHTALAGLLTQFSMLFVFCSINSGIVLSAVSRHYGIKVWSVLFHLTQFEKPQLNLAERPQGLGN